MLFIRRLDETQLLEEKKAAMINKPVANIIFTPEQQELRWNSFKNREPQAMFDLFQVEARLIKAEDLFNSLLQPAFKSVS